MKLNKIFVCIIIVLQILINNSYATTSYGELYEQEDNDLLTPFTVTINGDHLVTDDKEMTISAEKSCNECNVFYYWKATSGKIINNDNNSSITWKPPDVTTSEKHYVECIVGDGNGFISEDYLEVIVLDKTTLNDNNFLSTPIISGVKYGVIGELLSFTAISTINSSNEQSILYSFDWGDDSDVVFGDAKRSHTWSESGIYCIRATSHYGTLYSNQSECYYITINNKPDENNPPVKPIIKGPETGLTDNKYTFSVIATDPENNELEYYFDWGDNLNIEVTYSDTASHLWRQPGYYLIKVKVRDINGEESDWSSLHTIKIEQSNRNPEKPHIAGNNYVHPGESITLKTRSIDPDGDHTNDLMLYNFDWGDGTLNKNIPSNNQWASATHSYSDEGTYCIIVIAQDSQGLQSEKSDCKNITVEFENIEPERPVISGTTIGYINQTLTFTAKSVDPDNDQLEYSFVIYLNDDKIKFDWQQSNTINYKWGQEGTFCIKSAVKDDSSIVWSGCHNITIFSEQVPCKVKIGCPDPDSSYCFNQNCPGYLSSGSLGITYIDEDNNSQSDITSVDMYYSKSNTSTFQIIERQIQTGGYDWKIPDNLIDSTIFIKLVANYNTGCTSSVISKPLNIVDGSQPTIKILSPNGGKYLVGEPVEIKWEINCAGEYSPRLIEIGGDFSKRINGEQAKNTTSTIWIPDISDIGNKNQIRIKVFCDNCTENQVTSNYFTIEPKSINTTWNTERPIVKPNLSIPTGFEEYEWTQELIRPKIQVDKSGNIHIAAISSNEFFGLASYGNIYHREYVSNILYRKKSFSGWQTQEKATNLQIQKSDSYNFEASLIEYFDIEVDKNDRPHIIYSYKNPGTSGNIFYIFKSDFGWTSPQSIYSSKPIPKLLIDTKNKIYAFLGKAGYMYKDDNGSWSNVIMIPGLYMNSNAVVDNSDIVHVSYIARDESKNQYLSYNSIENNVISNSEYVSESHPYNNQIFSTNNKIYITGYVQPGIINYFLKDISENTWKHETLEWPEIYEGSPFIWRDKVDNTHFIYFTKNNDGKKQIMERMTDSSGWTANQMISSIPVNGGSFVDFGSNDNLIAVSYEAYYSGLDVYISYSDYSNVKSSPSIKSFAAEPNNGKAPFNTTFKLSVTPGSSEIIEYKYNFGDGFDYIGLDNEVNHTYSYAGTYNASVIIKDLDGYTSSSQITVQVELAHYYPLHITIFPQKAGTIENNFITCSDNCTKSLISGTNIQLTPVVNNGYLFSHWTGCLDNTDNICSISMDYTKNVYAIFICNPLNSPSFDFYETEIEAGLDYIVNWSDSKEVKQYHIQESTDINFSSIINENVVSNSYMAYNHSEYSELFYRVKAISECGSDSYWSEALKVKIKPKQYLLEVSCDPLYGGKIIDKTYNNFHKIYCNTQCSNTYPIDTTINLKAIPAEGFEFEAWDGCDEFVGYSCMVNINSYKNIKAVFKCEKTEPPTIKLSDININSRKSYTLYWDNLIAQSYIVQESFVNDFNVKQTKTLRETILSFVHDVDNNTILFYRVKSISYCGSESDWSNIVQINVMGNNHEVLYGDIDNNNSINLSDAILALNVCAGMKNDISVNINASINEHKKVSLSDLIYILKTISLNKHNDVQ
ncbi:hypothetical protein MHK_004826 [Candidatus Magnetomorum sp. HK-1]|nr:hypothetical protein MHK_004826 [Candidatus Magnetomorum sp. HK-1]